MLLLIWFCIIIILLSINNYLNLNLTNTETFVNIQKEKLQTINKINPAKSTCWISNSKFGEAEYIFINRDIIKKELLTILDSDLWGVWSSDSSSTPIFTKMSDNEITSRLESNLGKIGSIKEPAWRLFSLILNKKILPNGNLCPNTIKLLTNGSGSINTENDNMVNNNITNGNIANGNIANGNIANGNISNGNIAKSSRILNAGFSILEPGCKIGSHCDYNNLFYRLHIPLIIPDVNNKYINGNKFNTNTFIEKADTENLCVLQVENDYRIWTNDEYFIFDDTCQHDAWNNTDQIRIILIVDLEK